MKISRILSVVAVLLIIVMSLSLAACGKDDAVDNNEKSFKFEVVNLDGTTASFDITTTAATVGEALLAEGLIAGDNGQYGLYVKTVNGVTLDYNADGAYWAFYIGGEYAMTGVDSTDITEGETYSFRAEKG